MPGGQDVVRLRDDCYRAEKLPREITIGGGA